MAKSSVSENIDDKWVTRDQIKIISVKEGSVVVTYQLTVPEGTDGDDKSLIEELKN